MPFFHVAPIALLRSTCTRRGRPKTIPTRLHGAQTVPKSHEPGMYVPSAACDQASAPPEAHAELLFTCDLFWTAALCCMETPPPRLICTGSPVGAPPSGQPLTGKAPDIAN